MNEYQRIKLKIYEESTEENVNKLFISTYKRVNEEYKNKILEIKKLFKENKFNEALKCTKESLNKLDEIEKIIKETPSDLSSTLLSKLYTLLVKSLMSIVVNYLFKIVIKKLNSFTEDKLDKIKKLNKNMTDEEKKKLDSIEKSMVDMSKLDSVFSLQSSVEISAAGMGIKDLYNITIKGKSIKDCNDFKEKALNEILKERKKLKTLQNKIEKLQK